MLACQVLEWTVGDCFDFAMVLCSLLLGAGYDAYVVYGTAPGYACADKDVCVFRGPCGQPQGSRARQQFACNTQHLRFLSSRSAVAAFARLMGCMQAPPHTRFNVGGTHSGCVGVALSEFLVQSWCHSSAVGLDARRM